MTGSPTVAGNPTPRHHARPRSIPRSPRRRRVKKSGATKIYKSGKAYRDVWSIRRWRAGPGHVIGAMVAFFAAMGGIMIIIAGVAAAPDRPTMPQATSIAATAKEPSGKVQSLPASPPLRVDIAAIGVHAPVVAAGVDASGEVAVPPLSQPYRTNWYEDGPSPGQAGNAVILGHVDSKQVGAAVFYRLGQLMTGDDIDVTRGDGTVAVFRVTGVALYPKNKFPTDLVYGPSTAPGLRLITCGGSFDASEHTYRSNIIVAATMISSHHVTTAERNQPMNTYIPPKRPS